MDDDKLESFASRWLARYGVAWDCDEVGAIASLEAYHLHAQAFNRPCAAPLGDQDHSLLHVAVLLPVRIEVRRLVGDPHVVHECRQDRAIPNALHVGTQGFRIEGGGRGIGHRMSRVRMGLGPHKVSDLCAPVRLGGAA